MFKVKDWIAARLLIAGAMQRRAELEKWIATSRTNGPLIPDSFVRSLIDVETDDAERERRVVNRLIDEAEKKCKKFRKVAESMIPVPKDLDDDSMIVRLVRRHYEDGR